MSLVRVERWLSIDRISCTGRAECRRWKTFITMYVSFQGARVWIVEGDSADDWIPATIEANDSVEIVIKSDYGEVAFLF